MKGGLSALCNAIQNAACCMLVVPRPCMRRHTSQRCPPSGGGLHPHLLNNTIGVFAQPTLRPSPPHWLHPLPIPRQNNNASQKLILKEDNVRHHIPHLLVEVGEDVRASQKSPVYPSHRCKTMGPIASPSQHTLPRPLTLTLPSARGEDAFHKEVASTEMTTIATPLGGGFPNNSGHRYHIMHNWLQRHMGSCPIAACGTPYNGCLRKVGHDALPNGP